MRYRYNTESRAGSIAARGLALCAFTTALVVSGCSSSSDPAGPTTGETFLVDTSGGGDFATIQEGINVASNGDTVLVAPGTYSGPGNKDLEFGGASVVVKGTGTRDEVVIDCEGDGRGFYIDGNEAPVIENLKIANGSMNKGGGMYLEGSSPTIRNVRFVDNASIEGGGGIYCRNGSPSLEDILFDDNTAYIEGGGMLCVQSSPSLTRVTFLRNAAAGSGGGLSCAFSTPALSECVFAANSAGTGGAIYCGESSPSITSCTLVDNEGAQGSGIACADASAPAIRQSVVAYGAPGEALYCGSSESLPFTTLSCIFENGELNDVCGPHSTSMLYVDPLFCDLESGDLTLRADSPCLPENNQWGVLIGALGQGCGAPGR